MEHRCNCGSEHSAELGVSYNLFEKIDKDRVECLNEHEEGSGVKVFKTWEERQDRSQVSPAKHLFYNVYQIYLNIFHLALYGIFSLSSSMLKAISITSFCSTYRKYVLIQLL